jgi:uncharacterized HAD superfamily protein
MILGGPTTLRLRRAGRVGKDKISGGWGGLDSRFRGNDGYLMKRLLIGLDIDGVIVDSISSVLPLLSKICNRLIAYEDVTHPAISRFLNISEAEVEYIWEQILDTDLLQSSLPIDGAIEGIAALSRHEIWIITGRPTFLREITLSWLVKHRVNYERIIFDSDKTEGNLSQEKQCDVFIEDQLEAVNALADSGVFTLLFNQPWNQVSSLPGNCRRVHTWDDIVLAINGMESEIKGVA